MPGKAEARALAEDRAFRAAQEEKRIEAIRKSLEREPTQTHAMLARAFGITVHQARLIRERLGLLPGTQAAVVEEADR